MSYDLEGSEQRFTESLLYGSRWKCLRVEHMTKLGSATEMVLVIGTRLEDGEVRRAVLCGGKTELLDLLAIPGLQLQERLRKAEDRVRVLEKQLEGVRWAAGGGSL